MTPNQIGTIYLILATAPWALLVGTEAVIRQQTQRASCGQDKFPTSRLGGFPLIRDVRKATDFLNDTDISFWPQRWQFIGARRDTKAIVSNHALHGNSAARLIFEAKCLGTIYVLVPFLLSFGLVGDFIEEVLHCRLFC